MKPAEDPHGRPQDERLRRAGIIVVQRVLALMRIGRSYRVGNQVFTRQVESFLEAMAPVFKEAPEIVMVALNNDFYVNGVRVPLRSSTLRFQQALLEELRKRHIAGLKFDAAVKPKDIETFFEFFLQPDSYMGPALLEACVNAGLTRMLPAVHASTEMPEHENAYDPGAFEDWEASDEAAGIGAPGQGPGETRPPGARAVVNRSYSLAVHGARSVLTTTTLQDGVEMRHAKRVVQPLVDGAFQSEPVVMGLSTLGHHDEYTYAHAVNVCMVAVTMGHALGLDRRALADLGVAALLHDVGKASVYDRVHHPLEQFDAADRAAAEAHTVEGAKLIAHSTTLNMTTLRCMRAALEHHAGEGGYPALPEGWEASPLSRIIRCADAYVSMQMHRGPAAHDITPYDALGMMLGPLRTKFEPAMLWALVRTVGLYPPGQMVELADGRIAIVLAPNPEDLARPHLRVVMDECGVPFSPIEAKEYKPLPATMAIRRALPASEYPQMPQNEAA